MKRKQKKVVMYLDGERSIHKDVLKMALNECISLEAMKRQLKERFGVDRVTFKVE